MRLAALAVAGAADGGVRRRVRGGAAAVISSSGSSGRSDSGSVLKRGGWRGRLKLAGAEDGLGVGGVEPGGELDAHGDGVEAEVVAAAVLGELAGLDGGLAPRVGPVEQLHHLLVLHDLVAEGEPLGRRGLQEGLLLLAEHVRARGEPVGPEAFEVAWFDALVL